MNIVPPSKDLGTLRFKTLKFKKLCMKGFIENIKTIDKYITTEPPTSPF
jgi:hypothetical protein